MPSKSKSQQRFMGMVVADKKGGGAASPAVAKAAKSMSLGEAEDFARTKTKGLPNKVVMKSMKAKVGKKQGYNSRLDESLGARKGKKKQSLKARRDESKGMEKSMGKPAYSGNKSSRQLF